MAHREYEHDETSHAPPSCLATLRSPPARQQLRARPGPLQKPPLRALEMKNKDEHPGHGHEE